MKKLGKGYLLAKILLLLPVLSLANFAGITVSTDYDDGGRAGEDYLNMLISALNENGCNTVLSSTTGQAQLVFDSRPVTIAKKDRSDYQLIARAKTLMGKLTVRGAFLVHASTGIESLATLKGERIGFVNKKSWSGYILPIKTLKDAGITEQRNTFFIAGNHIGAVSYLLHSNMFATVTAEPLARRWAEANDLSIVALTDEVETGGWWIHRTVSKDKVKSCKLALSKLERAQLKAMPAWIESFETNWKN
ncbi:MAG: phosphate/phosphite/phosphonate ABC transporter substrate-binding protein [Gammaproteobacteria bacterium]|nr:phosphate/phosphite/phosphonate ABC transporter substrate-binding protein [Gammaproteobacteria bacterium]